MSEQEQIAALAKLDGMVACDMWMPSYHPLAGLMKSNCGHERCYPQQYPPPYLTSRDALWPIIFTFGTIELTTMTGFMRTILGSPQMLTCEVFQKSSTKTIAKAVLQTKGVWKD